jgi:hypothetical protein
VLSTADQATILRRVSQALSAQPITHPETIQVATSFNGKVLACNYTVAGRTVAERTMCADDSRTVGGMKFNVEEEWRRRGIATALNDHLYSALRQSRVRFFTISTDGIGRAVWLKSYRWHNATTTSLNKNRAYLRGVFDGRPAWQGVAASQLHSERSQLAAVGARLNSHLRANIFVTDEKEILQGRTCIRDDGKHSEHWTDYLMARAEPHVVLKAVKAVTAASLDDMRDPLVKRLQAGSWDGYRSLGRHRPPTKLPRRQLGAVTSLGLFGRTQR